MISRINGLPPNYVIVLLIFYWVVRESFFYFAPARLFSPLKLIHKILLVSIELITITLLALAYSNDPLWVGLTATCLTILDCVAGVYLLKKMPPNTKSMQIWVNLYERPVHKWLYWIIAVYSVALIVFQFLGSPTSWFPIIWAIILGLKNRVNQRTAEDTNLP